MGLNQEVTTSLGGQEDLHNKRNPHVAWQSGQLPAKLGSEMLLNSPSFLRGSWDQISNSHALHPTGGVCHCWGMIDLGTFLCNAYWEVAMPMERLKSLAVAWLAFCIGAGTHVHICIHV